MAEPEQNEKMDGLLRGYAKRPRPAAELHPVSRRALQEEVQKVFGAAEARPKKAKFWPAWWIRWPVAAGFAAWAVLLVMNNRRFEDGQALSRKEATWLASEDAKKSKQERDLAAAESFAASAAPAPSASPVMAPASPPGAATALMPEGRAFGGSAGRMRSVPAGTSGQLFQNNAPAQQVLNNFRVARQGDDVLVRDGDGSVYAGKVSVAPQSQAKALNAQAVNSGYSFAVQGMNRSIQQSVYFAASVAGANAGTQLISNAQNQLQAPARNQVQQGTAARVTGTVTVGGTNQYPVEATAPGAP